MEDALQIIEGTERWEPDGLRFDATVNGKERNFLITAHRLDDVDLDHPGETLLRNLEPLRDILLLMGQEDGPAERKLD